MSGTTDRLKGTEEQEAIWKRALESDTHIVVKAVAGSGKTWTGVQYCLRAPKDLEVAYVAFNKHIQIELKEKIRQSNVVTKTYHSLGYAALTYGLGWQSKVDRDKNKVGGILESLIKTGSRRDKMQVRFATQKLVSLAKQYGVIEREDLETLVDHHLIDLEGIEEWVYNLVPKTLRECKANTRTIDYDDMVWLPKELGLRMPRYDLMIIDEAQDTNPAQQWLALHSADRLIVIGDPNQAIYGFRGADVMAMENIKDELGQTGNGVVEMPLTLTRRCPKSHVQLAQRIVPEIHALDTAPEGIIRIMDHYEASQEMRPGDLVLCRTNADLAGAAYQLIKRGTKAIVRGKNIGEGIERLIQSAQKRLGACPTVSDLMKTAWDITGEQFSRYMRIPNDKGVLRAGAVQDRYQCLAHLATDADSVDEIHDRIQKIFRDFDDTGRPVHAVTLGTVHRTKGLEASRVFVLRPELIPHPAAKREWERQQERNLGYVACTRAKYTEDHPGELIWVGNESPLFV